MACMDDSKIVEDFQFLSVIIVVARNIMMIGRFLSKSVKEFQFKK